MPTTGYDLLTEHLWKSNFGESVTYLKRLYRDIQSQNWENSTKLKVSCKKGAKSTRKLAFTFFKTAFPKQRARIWIISFVWHEILSSFVHSNWILCVKVISVRLGVKLKSLSRECMCHQLSLNTKSSALIQDKLFFSIYSQVLDDHFAAFKMSVDILFTEIILILSQIRVW